MNVWWRMYALKLVQLLLYGSCVNHWYMLLLLSVRVEEIISLRVKGFMRKGLSVCDRSFWVVTKTSPSATCSWILRRLSVSNKNWLLDVCSTLNPLVQCLIWEPQLFCPPQWIWKSELSETHHYQNSHCFHGKLDRIGCYVTDTIDWLDSIAERIRWCWSDFETFENFCWNGNSL